MKRVLYILVALTVLAAPALADYSETREMEVGAGNIEILKIDCGAGFLEIKGVNGLESIKVKAQIFLDNVSGKKAEEFIEENLILELTASGRTAKLISDFEQSGFLSNIFHFGGSRVIDLTVTVPAGIELRIDDGSGYIEIQDMESDVTIDDGSGEIVCENIKGNVNINDGSGHIEIREIQGNVTVDDGSGNIRIDEVTEDVQIINEGSGQCSITNVDGDIDR